MKVKYNVMVRGEGIIGVVWAAPEHLGGREEAVREVAGMFGYEPQYLVAKVADNQEPSRHTSVPFHHDEFFEIL